MRLRRSTLTPRDDRTQSLPYRLFESISRLVPCLAGGTKGLSTVMTVIAQSARTMRRHSAGRDFPIGAGLKHRASLSTIGHSSTIATAKSTRLRTSQKSPAHLRLGLNMPGSTVVSSEAMTVCGVLNSKRWEWGSYAAQSCDIEGFLMVTYCPVPPHKIGIERWCRI